MSAPLVRVCAVADLPVGARRCVRLPDGCGVLVVNVRDRLYALDHACYRALNRDQLTVWQTMGVHWSLVTLVRAFFLIPRAAEELDGRATITCPWHHYKIALDNGEGLYLGIDPANPFSVSLKSKGVKQRTHEVVVEGSDVFVRPAPRVEPLPSDDYATIEFAASALEPIRLHSFK